MSTESTAQCPRKWLRMNSILLPGEHSDVGKL
jgi:hypothetical protein